MIDRKKYLKEFKLGAVSLVIEQGSTRVEVAKNFGVHHSMLGCWVRKHQEADDHAFRGNGELIAEQEEIKDLNA